AVVSRSSFRSTGCCVAHPDLHSFPTRRSSDLLTAHGESLRARRECLRRILPGLLRRSLDVGGGGPVGDPRFSRGRAAARRRQTVDRKSTRLNSSHVSISYAVFCLKKKKNHRST